MKSITVQDEAAPSLFPDLTPVDLPAREDLSAGQRLTVRQRADVERGRHPLTRGPVSTIESATCGNCAFRVPGRWPKCHWRPGATEATTGRMADFPHITHGPATDCRAWWPGCTEWRRA